MQYNNQIQQHEKTADLEQQIADLERSNNEVTQQLKNYADDFNVTIQQRENAYNSLLKSHADCIERLSIAAALKDDDTGTHIVRMAEISQLIARAYGESDAFCELILQASPMHDIGKIGIPDNVLKKEGKLTESEMEIMRQHPVFGYEILKGSEVLMFKMTAEIALSHHEKFDGSGYPYGLKGDMIPLSGQITAIADVFDALTMDRCYRPAMSDSVAFSIIENERGKHFSPQIVDAFFSISNDIIQMRETINKNANPQS